MKPWRGERKRRRRWERRRRWKRGRRSKRRRGERRRGEGGGKKKVKLKHLA